MSPYNPGYGVIVGREDQESRTTDDSVARAGRAVCWHMSIQGKINLEQTSLGLRSGYCPTSPHSGQKELRRPGNRMFARSRTRPAVALVGSVNTKQQRVMMVDLMRLVRNAKSWLVLVWKLSSM